MALGHFQPDSKYALMNISYTLTAMKNYLRMGLMMDYLKESGNFRI